MGQAGTSPGLGNVVARLLALRRRGRARLTLLAVCPNSAAVLEAAVKVAAETHAPMLFAATLNQVDRDGGYTGWTPAGFVAELDTCRRKYACHGALYPCLDHGGPWLKDRHTTAGLSLAETLAELRRSLVACLEAGYSLLHVDATVDRTLPPDRPVPIERVVERTAELMAYCEAERQRRGLPAVAYEVGTEEVHGGLADFASFERFVQGLRAALAERDLLAAWPAFVVGKVGTDLHTSDFDPATARRLDAVVAPLGSLVKGHYTDWVANPADYPASGMGGANVGPELTAAEYLALADLASREADLLRGRPGRTPSGVLAALEAAVVEGSRWQKWLQPAERGVPFAELPAPRREWLVQTGARYVWTDPRVLAAREHLYHNLALAMPDPHGFVVDRIGQVVQRYVTHFRLFDALALLGRTDDQKASG